MKFIPLVFTAMLMPFILFGLLVLPSYSGLCMSVALTYSVSGNPLPVIMPYAADPELLLRMYGDLVRHWQTHEVSFTQVTLPLFGPVVIGVVTALGLFIVTMKMMIKRFSELTGT